MGVFAFGALNINRFSGGRKTVTTAGTEVQLTTTETPCHAVIIQALKTNTGLIAYGGSDVVAAAGSENGVILEPGEKDAIECLDASKIYIDSRVNGEGVSYLLLHG